MFCAASATAMPPMPRPARSGLISMPRLSSVSSSTNDQIVARDRNPIIPSELAAARSVVSVSLRFRSSEARTAVVAHKPICQNAAIVKSVSAALLALDESCSVLSPANNAAINVKPIVVRLATCSGSSKSSVRGVARSLVWYERTSRRNNNSATNTTSAIAAATAHCQVVLPKYFASNIASNSDIRSLSRGGDDRAAQNSARFASRLASARARAANDRKKEVALIQCGEAKCSAEAANHAAILT